MCKVKVTVLTPTYNRRKYLPELMESLQTQTNFDFEWLIIDDGSSDDTESYMLEVQLQKNNFPIKYYKKENGGKHTALNYAHPYIAGELVCIVDSDDYLFSDAIEVIINDWKKYSDCKGICGLSYLKQGKNGEIYSALAKKDFYIDDDISWRTNCGIHGDRCEVIRTDILKEYLFPVLEGERFMPEGWLWTNMALQYKMVYRNRAIYCCEYLEGGLTKRGRLLRMQNPLGMMENCKANLIPQVCFRVQIKEMLLFWVYGLCAGYSSGRIADISGRPVRMMLCFLPGWVLYEYWSKKYHFKR